MALAVAVLAGPARGQPPLHEIGGRWTHSEHGSVISPRFGDPWQPGVKIFCLIGAPLDGSAGPAAGKVTIASPPLFSGGALSVFRTHLGTDLGGRFGSSAIFVGDIDGDQCGDYAIGAAGARRVFVYSGASGSLLHTFWDPAGFGFVTAFGHSLASFDAVQGDGQRDLAIGAPLDNDATGVVYVYSLTTWQLRGFRRGEAVGDRFGWSLDAPAFKGPPATYPADPAREKVLVGAPRAGANERGRAYVIEGIGAGSTLNLWSKVQGTQDFAHLGEAVCANDDMLYVGAPDALGVGRVSAYRAGGPGQSGFMTHVNTKYGAQAGERFGAMIVVWHRTPFLDNNDRIAVGSPGYDLLYSPTGETWTDAGRLRVFGYDPGSLGSSWNFATAPTWSGGAAGSHFGSAACGDAPAAVTATAANYGVVGAPHHSPGGMPNSGSVARVVGVSGQLVGTAGGGAAGTAVAGVGDIDGDGRSEFAVSSPDEVLANPYTIGVVRLHSGANGAVLRTITLPAYMFGGFVLPLRSLDARFGATMAGIGDVNGDGAPDLLVGAPETDPNQLPTDNGAAWVFSGATGEVLHQVPTPSSSTMGPGIGSAVAGGLDVDGDTRPDFAVSTIDRSNFGGGHVHAHVGVFSGATGAWIRTIYSVQAEQFGAAIVFVPDLNADGRAEIAISAPGANSYAGVVRVYSGASGSQLLTLSLPGSVALGRSLAAGDVDGDGRADLLVGSSATSNGRISVFSGASGSLLYSLSGATSGDLLGMRIVYLGDLDNDGRGDFAATAQGGIPANGGAVRVFSGASGALIRQVQGTGAGVVFGASLAAAGDVDADGYLDWIAGAPMAPTTTQKRGMARVYTSR